MTQQPVIFLHIPKAAGSTLLNIVRRQYNSDSIFSVDGKNPLESIKQFKLLQKNKTEATQAVMGHMYFGVHEFLPNSTYITMLRDPIERIISFYYYVLRNPDHNHYNLITSKNLSLKDYVKSGIGKQLDNGQTRLLSGIDALDVEFGSCSETMLSRAKLNIQKYFSVVGITEKFDESLLLMKSKLNWKKSILYRKANVTKNRPKKLDIPEVDLKEIEKQNEFDIELYRYAEELFTNQLQENYIEKNLRQFIFLNNNYQTYTKTIGKFKSIFSSTR
ncbi:MAG: sulfotransferase family 2 domain-containing protein [Cyanobacteria bacterium P01_D01_bin.50]